MSRTLFSALATLVLSGCVSALPIEPFLTTLVECQPDKPKPDAIVGGEEVSLFDPDQSLVTMIKIRRDDHESVCTGTLISDRLILTAAHCISDVAPKKIRVRFRTTESCPVNHSRYTEIEAVKSIIHEDFDGTPQSLADLGLLVIASDAPKKQKRVSLIGKNEEATSDSALLIGFGITGETMKDSQILRRIRKSLKDDFQIREKAIVIDQTKKKGGFCRGDSGAPVLVDVWGESKIFAVNSANVGITKDQECQTLSVAMNLRHFSDWVQKTKRTVEESTGPLSSLLELF